MKTVIQELINEIKENINGNAVVRSERMTKMEEKWYLGANKAMKDILTDLQKRFRDKEKQQLTNAYNQGYRDGENAEESTKALVDVSEWADAEIYYNNTFKKTDNAKEV